MPWDDLSPFLVGSGPTSTVLDPGANANTIIEHSKGGKITTDWSFSGLLTSLLPNMQFNVNVYSESIGEGPEGLVGSVSVAGTAVPPPAEVQIPPSSTQLPPPGPGVSGVYKLTTVVTSTLLGNPFPVAGYAEGPIVQVRP
jgi:hypothetical protein